MLNFVTVELIDAAVISCLILFIDFTKAFDLIDHNVLCRKMQDLNIPPHLCTWFLSFLSDRQQFVKVDKIAPM